MRHLRLYRAIRLIVKTGSIRKAAEYLMISPSALNRSIQGFEAELGVQIFERVASGVRLSTAGELLFRLMAEHLDEMDDFSVLLSELQSGTAGHLRLSVSADIAPEPLGGALAAFRSRFPKVSIEILPDETHGRLLGRDVDLALVTLPRTDDGVEVAFSHLTPLVGRVAANHPKAGQTIDLSDLATHTLVVPPQGSGVRAAVDIALRRHRIEPGGLLVYPGDYPALVAGDRPDLQICLAGHAGPQGSAPVQVPDLRLASVQITALARAEGSLPRNAMHFVTVLNAVLESPTPA